MTNGQISSGPSAPIRVLLVEDTPIDAELVLRQLKRHGFTFQSKRVSTESEFLQALMGFDPDVILSDYSMPRFSGLRALELTRQLAADIPFIFVSGSVRPQDATTAFKDGAVDFVTKDDLMRLGPAIQNALVGSRNLKS